MTATITVLRILRKPKEEQASKVGRQVRVRLFRRIEVFPPMVAMNPYWWEKGRVITENDDEKTLTVRFKDEKGHTHWRDYPADAVKILPNKK